MRVPARSLARRLTALALLAASSLALAQQPSRTSNGPELWTDPAPAVYRIRAAGTDLCATREAGALRTQLPHLVLRPCASPIGFQAIALSPFSWQSLGTTDASNDPFAQPLFVFWRMTTPFNSNCLTAARGVVFGAPAVDELACESGPDGAPSGANDQLWNLRQRGAARTFEIRTLDRRCWTAQGGELRSGVQLVLERCDERPGQLWTIAEPQGDVIEEFNRQAAVDFGWLPIENRGSSPPFRVRAMPGTNLPSGDYTQGIETANDQGRECAQICAADDRCRGFTWVNPVQRQGRAMCYKKEALNTPVQDPFTVSGIIRP